MTVAESLRKIRKAHKLTQQDVASVLGIDRTTYTLYELGMTFPSIASLGKLSDAYNATVGYIIGKENTNCPERIIKDAELVREESVDAVAYLPKDERSLLFSYRVLSDEDKQKIKKEILDLVNEK